MARCSRLTVVLTTTLLMMLPGNGFAEQVFVKEPTDLRRIQDQTAILECTIDNRVGDVIWTKDGFGLAELQHFPRYSLVGDKSKGEYWLMISNVNLEDDDVYECQVISTATVPGLRSRRAKVTVLVPCTKLTVVDGRPLADSSYTVTVDVVADTPHNLTCVTSNSRPAGAITWYEDGTRIPASSNRTHYSVSPGDNKLDNATAMLTILPTRHDKSQYKCEVINATLRGNNMARWIILNVQYAPIVSITVSPLHMLREGATVTFTCSATANPNVITWKWFVDKDLIPGVSGPVYRLDRISHTHNGRTIRCEASNKVGATSQQHLLDVDYGPRLVRGPQHAEVDLGGEAILNCDVDSNPDAEIRWQREDQLIKHGKTLIIPQVAPVDLGVYTCIAEVHGFPSVQQYVQILQKGPPHITSPAKQSAKFGSVGFVKCRMRSVPQPTVVEWRKNGVLLDLTKHKRYQITEETLPDGRVSTIQIRSVQDEDFGDYNCSLDNGYGKHSLRITLTKQDVVPLAYILAGVLLGILVIFAISIAIFVYHRKKKSSLAEGSENSDDSSTKRKTAELTPDYKPYVDTWRPEFDQKYYRNSADYDELRYPGQQDGRWSASIYERDYPDGRNYGYDPRRDYGTYPGSTAIPPRYDNGNYIPPRPAEYATYGRAPSRQNYPQMAPLPPAIPESKLSTNV